MRFWCVEHMHRLPEEIHEGFSALLKTMVAYAVVSKKHEKKN